MNSLIQARFCSAACTYSGVTYTYGQSFVGDDSCSRCYCGVGGTVTCDNTPCSKWTYILQCKVSINVNFKQARYKLTFMLK